MEAASTDETREAQVLEAAERLVLQRGSLAISFNDIADSLGVSRSLLYVYFDSVPAILNALYLEHSQNLERLFEPLLASKNRYLEKATGISCAYLDHVIETGPLMQLMLREHRQDSPLGATGRAHFRKVLRSVTTETSRSLELGVRETFVFLELQSAIPEALGRLVRDDQIDRATAMKTCERLVAASVESFTVSKGS